MHSLLSLSFPFFHDSASIATADPITFISANKQLYVAAPSTTDHLHIALWLSLRQAEPNLLHSLPAKALYVRPQHKQLTREKTLYICL